jgi:HK97 family phage prohead protease
MHALTLPLELKSIADGGRFEGYAAVVGNVDAGGDVIVPGAFKEFVLSREGRLTLLWQHQQRTPIGVATVAEDAKGLRVVGDLVLEDPLARAAHAHMKAGSARGMSIGYDVLPGGKKTLQSGVRQLTAIKVWEASIVTFPMNTEATVEYVKQLPANVREFERCLRDIGFSQKRATAIALHGFGGPDHDDDVDGDEVEVVAAALRFLTRSLKGN